jgi:hypothetical protein
MEKSIEVVRALYPRKVALLTLRNDCIGGGTRLHFRNKKRDDNDASSEDSTVVCCEAGDLLIFDNVNMEHSVDMLRAKPGIKEGENIIRQIIGNNSHSRSNLHLIR